jgi:FkbM family methyltransferase
VKTVYGWAFPEADEFMSSELHPDGTYQAQHFRMALGFVKQKRMAVDGGAHVGTWSRLMANEFTKVIAVEPSADTFEALQSNMQAFGCANVEIRNMAIGAIRELVSMAPLDAKAEALRNTGARFIQAGGTILCEPIDDWNLPDLDFLKLDVEGSEPFALEGARATLKRCKPIVLFENKGLCKRFGRSVTAPQTVLQGMRYRQLAVAGRDVIWGPV